jgi:hypothetical protein
LAIAKKIQRFLCNVHRKLVLDDVPHSARGDVDVLGHRPIGADRSASRGYLINRP